MAGKEYSITIRDFSGGMASSPDPADLPVNIAQDASNIELLERPGVMMKSYQTVLEDFNRILPNGQLPHKEEVISIGHLTYTKEWVNDVKVNQQREMLVIQVNGSVYFGVGEKHSFDWYELWRDIGSKEWFLDGPFYCDYNSGSDSTYSPEFQGKYGTTKPGKIIWNEYKGILRGAAGAFLDPGVAGIIDEGDACSYPVLWRQVNRYPTDPTIGDNHGFFRNNFSATAVPSYLHDRYSFNALYRGRTIPDFTPTFDIYRDNAMGDFFFAHDGYGYGKLGKLKYVVVAEYDGHQIVEMKSEPLIVEYGYINDAIADDLLTYAVKLHIDFSYGGLIAPERIEDLCPPRLTALNIYRANMPLQYETSLFAGWGVAWMPERYKLDQAINVGVNYGNYELIGRINTEDGMKGLLTARAKAVVSATGCFSFQTGAPGAEGIIIEPIYSAGFHNLYEGCFVSYEGNDGNTYEYKIIDSYYAVESGTGLHTLNVRTSDPPQEINIGEYYIISINARWDQVEFVVGQEQGLRCVFVDLNRAVGSAPYWLSSQMEFEDQPKITCNYSRSMVYKSRNFVNDLIYDGGRYRNMVRYSNPPNSEFAGMDIFPNYIMPNLPSDEYVLGTYSYLDFVIIMTNKRFIRYLLLDDGMSEQLSEYIWDTGVESVSSFIEIDGVTYFLAKRGNKINVGYWVPQAGKPVLLDKIEPTLQNILRQPNLNPEYAMGIPLLAEHKYLLSIPSYREL